LVGDHQHAISVYTVTAKAAAEAKPVATDAKAAKAPVQKKK
jgi:hypothetical protein